MFARYSEGFKRGLDNVVFEGPEDSTSLIALIKKAIEGVDSTDSAPNVDEILKLGAVLVDGKRAFDDIKVTKNSRVKFARFPRRFPAFEQACLHGWPTCSTAIVKETDRFIMVAKPSGIPAHATVDNAVENVLAGLKRFLYKDSNAEDYFITHRLDVPTRGVMVVAKTSEAATYFNELFSAPYRGVKRDADGEQKDRSRNLRKIYRAFCRKRKPDAVLETKTYTHYLTEQCAEQKQGGLRRSQKLIRDEPCKGAKACQLRVLRWRQVTVRKPSTNFTPIPAAVAADGEVVEVLLELGTGRTHQIRAQLSHLGFCIVGDAVYGSGDATFNDVDSCPDDEFFGLESHLISFVDDDGKRITASLSPEIEELFQDGKLHATDVEVAV